MNVFLGIDPGISGAVALLISPNAIFFWETPTIQSGGKRRYDVQAMEGILQGHCLEAIRENASEVTAFHVILEKAQAMPKQGSTSMFNYGRGAGLWEGLLAGMKFPYTLVAPQRWKRIMMPDMAKDKGASILRAKQLFPECASQLQLVKDHNKAEALLLAAYGQRL